MNDTGLFILDPVWELRDDIIYLGMRSKSQLDLGLGSLQKRLSAGTGKSPTS
jgi:hypothetical protein